MTLTCHSASCAEHVEVRLVCCNTCCPTTRAHQDQSRAINVCLCGASGLGPHRRTQVVRPTHIVIYHHKPFSSKVQHTITRTALQHVENVC